MASETWSLRRCGQRRDAGIMCVGEHGGWWSIPEDRGLCEAAEEKRAQQEAGRRGASVECATYQILSGWPSPTDSEVKRKVLFWAAVSWEGTTAGYVWLGQTYFVGRAVDTVGDSHLGRYGWRGRCGRGNVGIAGGGWEGGGASVGLATACLTTGKKKKGLGWVGEKRGMEGKAGRRALMRAGCFAVAEKKRAPSQGFNCVLALLADGRPTPRPITCRPRLAAHRLCCRNSAPVKQFLPSAMP